MTYAGGRVIHDADSHLMETTDWLVTYADPDMRERIRPLQLGGAGALADKAVADDYPHPEGTKDPIAKFEANLDGVSAEARDRFYERNFADLMSWA